MDRFGGPVLLAALGLWLGLTGSVVKAQTPASCDEGYTQAEKAYYAANFEAAERALRPCLDPSAVSDSVRVQAYRLLGFIHLGQNDREAARLAVESLIDLRPTYTPDPQQDRPDFVALVRTVKEERGLPTAGPDKGGRRWLRWVAGGIGVAALGTVAALLLGGGGGSNGGTESLPPPDVPPQ